MKTEAWKKLNLADPVHCSGCGACVNVCPKSALSMVSDEEGFLQPVLQEDLCVHCHKCENTCPVLHPVYENEIIDSCYAMWAEDDIRKIASSGGFFRLAAQHVLGLGGTVYGAAWTEDYLHVRHIRADSEDGILRISGSKYIQSDAGDSYRQAKADLDAGKTVLYTGCPCQIAAMYAVLGEVSERERLYTIEVVCHGVPSEKAYQKFLRDNFDVEDIASVNFRDKSFGWATDTTVRFKSGKPLYHKTPRDDPFFHAFLPCMILRKSCAECPFSRLPRQADISLGDYWGIDRVDRSWNDRKGTGQILVNSKKGQELFRLLESKFKRCEKLPLETATLVNKTIIHPFNAHPGRKHFFSSMELKPFNELVEASLNHHYDVGIVGLWYGINFGSVLTYFALYTLIRDIGLDPVMLPKPNNMWTEKFNDPESLGQKFIWKHCNVFATFRDQGEYPRVNDLCKDFLVGSDVVWNYDICGKESDQFFFLDWVEAGHKKIAFAASTGNGLEGEEKYRRKAQYYLKKFDAISVRETKSAEDLGKLCGRDDIVRVLDPVFVCNQEIYRRLAEEAGIAKKEPFVFFYLLRHSTTRDTALLGEYLCRKYDAVRKTCTNPVDTEAIARIAGEKGNVIPDVSVEAWLYYMSNCEFYVGDSYHALCFSLIFHRPFVICYQAATLNYSGLRFRSLLELVGLEYRMIEEREVMLDPEKFRSIVDRPIDWEDVERRLEPVRADSLNWLKQQFSAPGRPAEIEQIIEDDLRRTISELSARVGSLEQKIGHGRIEEMERRIALAGEEVRSIRASKIWKLWYSVTWLPRKLLNWTRGK